MKKYLTVSLMLLLLGASALSYGSVKNRTRHGRKFLPNLIVRYARINFATKTVHVIVKNIGNASAGGNRTYVEINAVGAPATQKPQTQAVFLVGALAPGASRARTFPFSSFPGSPARGNLDVNTLTRANLVVTADAKKAVFESNEGDNISNTIQH